MNGKVPRGKLNSLETVFKLCELCKALDQEVDNSHVNKGFTDLR